MKKIVINILNCIVGASILAGCGSGNTSTPQQSTQSADLNPQGPIDYKMMIADMLKANPNYNPSSSKNPNKSLNGTTVGQRLWLDTGVVASFNPFARTPFAVLTPWVTQGLSSHAPSASTNEIYANELYIESQIKMLQNTLATDNNYFYNYYQAQVNQETDSATYNFNSIITYINNTYQNYTDNVLGVGPSTSVAESLPSLTTTQITSLLSSTFNALNNANVNVSGVTQNPTGIAGAITNSTCSNTTPYDYAALTSTTQENTQLLKIINANQPMASINNIGQSSLVALLNDMQTQLTTYLKTPGLQIESTNANYVQTIQQYNQQLANIYGQTILALQRLYTMEASINYVSYTNPSSAPSGSLNDCTWSMLSGDQLYLTANPNVTADSANANFINAQAALAQLYANRINILYKTIASYVVSDHVLPQQQNLSGTATVDYPFIESTTQAKTLQNPVVTANQIVSGNWINSFNLYQESGLIAYKQCSQAIYDGEPLSSLEANCPSILPNQSNGYYNGVNLSVYNNQNQLATINLGNCVAANGISTWGTESVMIGYEAPNVPTYIVTTPTYGLMCNLNNVAQNYTLSPSLVFTQNNGTNTIGSASNILGANGFGPAPADYNYNDLGPNGSFAVAKNNQDFHIYLQNLASNITLVNGNNRFYLQNNGGQFSLYNGGIYQNTSNQTAYIHITLPNGFILPISIVAYSSSSDATGMTYLNLAIPATIPVGNIGSVVNNEYLGNIISSSTSYIPGVTGFYYPNDGGANGGVNGGLTVGTADGNLYMVSLSSGAIDSGSTTNQSAYLSIQSVGNWY